MASMVGIYAAEFIPPMVLIFTIVWFLMRKRGQKLKLSIVWYIGGFLTSLLLAGLVRYILFTVFGYVPALHADKDALLLIYGLIPILISLFVCALIRTKYTKVVDDQ